MHALTNIATPNFKYVGSVVFLENRAFDFNKLIRHQQCEERIVVAVNGYVQCHHSDIENQRMKYDVARGEKKVCEGGLREVDGKNVLTE